MKALVPTITACAIAFALGVSTAADKSAAQHTLMRAGERTTIEGPAANFTGKARIDRQVRPDASARAMGSLVSFEAGARTAWHMHPLGQTLVVTNGCGWVQTEGGPVQELLPGDVVWTPANVRHWHGAQPHREMSHYAMAEPVNGSAATWQEKVSDEIYATGKSELCKS